MTIFLRAVEMESLQTRQYDKRVRQHSIANAETEHQALEGAVDWEVAVAHCREGRAHTTQGLQECGVRNYCRLDDVQHVGVHQQADQIQYPQCAH
jgi:hypothetical protein